MKVCIIVEKMIPGGGPPGYVNNFRIGLASLVTNGGIVNNYIIPGELEDLRNNVAKKSTVLDLFKKLAIKKIYKKLLNYSYKEKIRSIRSADAVVFHGPQDETLLDIALSSKSIIVYMPHSPVPASEEYKRTSELNGNFEENHWKKIQNTETNYIKKSNYIVFPTIEAAEPYISCFNIDKNKCAYIESGVDVGGSERKIIKDGFKDSGKINIIFAGRYIDHKGFDLYCEAVDVIGDKFEGIADMYCCGDGPLRDKVPPKLNNLGWRNDAIDLIDSADIVIVPNRVAYFDLLPLEAAALGKPMVMTKVGGNIKQLSRLPDCIGSEVDVDSLVEAIELSVDKKINDNKWGIKNKLKYYKHYKSEHMVKRWDEFFSAL